MTETPYQAGATTFLHEHRAFVRQPRAGRTLAGALALTLVAGAAWAAALPVVGLAWGHALAALVEAGLPGRVVMTVYAPLDTFGAAGAFEVGVPSLALDASAPSGLVWMATLIVTVIAFAASFVLPDRLTPLAYAVRAAVAVQASAIVYFLAWPEAFPYTLTAYLEGMSVTGLAIATAAIPVLGLTYYIQDVSWLHKAGLTVLALAHSVVLVPLQYAAQGLLLHDGSLLFMPILYLFFGIPLHIFSLVALFAWGMSWRGRLPRLGIPTHDAHLAPQHESTDPHEAWVGSER